MPDLQIEVAGWLPAQCVPSYLHCCNEGKHLKLLLRQPLERDFMGVSMMQIVLLWAAGG